MKVSGLLAKKSSQIITIQPEETIEQGIYLLNKHNIGILLVVNTAGKLVGVFSERDIMRRLPALAQRFEAPVAEVMSTDLITAVPQDDLMSVVHIMTEKRIRHLPVVEADEMVGIISIGDVLKAQRDQYLGEIDTLETQILAE